MSNTRGPSPGAARHPDHRVQISSAANSCSAQNGATVLARSDAALIVDESGYPPVVYFPSQDVRLEHLVATESKTTCPFKGEAHYFALAEFPHEQDVAWTYPLVYDEVAELAGYIAFYEDRVQVSHNTALQS